MNQLLKDYGQMRPVRYLVTSATEFKEIVTTTNLIFTRAGALAEIEALERVTPFSVIPLPESASRFIACFDVPAVLLGDGRDRETLRLDFGNVELSADRFHYECSDGGAKFCYFAGTLFEANLALAHFESRIARIVGNGNRLTLRRTVRLQVFPPTDKVRSNRLEFLLPALSAEQIKILRQAVRPQSPASADITHN
jgi:hypothetical protein